MVVLTFNRSLPSLPSSLIIITTCIMCVVKLIILIIIIIIIIRGMFSVRDIGEVGLRV